MIGKRRVTITIALVAATTAGCHSGVRNTPVQPMNSVVSTTSMTPEQKQAAVRNAAMAQAERHK